MAKADKATKAAEDRLRAAAQKRDKGLEDLNRAVVETADTISRRRAAALIGRTSGRVQQIIDEAGEGR